MPRTTQRSGKVIKLSPKLGLPPDKRTHFRCGHERRETGAWLGDVFRCEPCYHKAQRTYRRARREMERTL